jgi:hypothetical protein
MAGYSGTPLARKLGIAPHAEVLLIDAPDDYQSLVAPLPDGVRFGSRLSRTTTVVHMFSTRERGLRALLTRLRPRIAPEAVVWVSWPKQASRVATDITEDTIRAIALPLGFVDVKVCAVTDVWSGLKLVIRKELRSARK